MIFTTFYIASGEIVGRLDMPSVSDALLNVGDGIGIIEGDYFSDDNFVSEGVVMKKPPRPGPEPYWRFDGVEGVWFDPRDPGEVLALARAAASMSRSDFLLAAIRAGIIQPSDAGPAARGEIPPSLAPVFSGMPPEVQLEAVVRWGAATMIDRTNPVLAALAAAMTVTDAQLDALFGI